VVHLRLLIRKRHSYRKRTDERPTVTGTVTHFSTSDRMTTVVALATNSATAYYSSMTHNADTAGSAPCICCFAACSASRL